MQIYFKKTNGNNLVIITDGETAKIFNAAPTGIYEGVDLCAEDAADQLRDRFHALSESGDLNDFSDWCGGDETEIGPELIEEMEEADLVYSDPSDSGSLWDDFLAEAGLLNRRNEFPDEFLHCWAGAILGASPDPEMSWRYNAPDSMDSEEYSKNLDSGYWACIQKEDLPGDFRGKSVKKCRVFAAQNPGGDIVDPHEFSVVVFDDGSALYVDGWSAEVNNCPADLYERDVFCFRSELYYLDTGEKVLF